MQDNFMFHAMFQNALIGLSNGCLQPLDKELLSHTPLPSDFIEPYTTKEVPDVLDSMKLTFSAMSIWIDEAKKVNYFSKRFVQLSKLVMNGVTTMGRGLITLHARGEDLSAAPMSIFDLIGVASYHFRKSYLGVLQTSRSHPEIGERLLMNQIGWNNMLMRLYKTREKLSVVKCAVLENEEGRMKKEELASGSMLPSNSVAADDGTALPEPLERAFAVPSAFSAPGALTAPRAFSSYDKKERQLKARVPSSDKQPGNEEERPENKEGRLKNEDIPSPTDDQAVNEDGEMKKEGDGARNKEISGTNDEIEIEIKEKQKAQENNSQTEDDETEITEGTQTKDDETRITKNTQAQKNETRIIEDTQTEEVEAEREEPLQIGGDEQETDPELPLYLQILQDVYARGGQSEDGALSFTFDELCYLAADPDFNRIYPQQAAQMRSILQKLDSS